MKAKFKFFLTAIAIILAFSAISCSNSNKKTDESTIHTEHELAQYTCSMHPEVIKNEPGNCPECGMALIDKKSHDEAGDMNEGHEESDDNGEGHDHDHENGTEHSH